VNQQKQKIGTNYLFKSNENTVQINFHAISHKNKGVIQYQYRIYPNDSTWVTTSNRFIILSSLSPGKYFVELKTNKYLIRLH